MSARTALSLVRRQLALVTALVLALTTGTSTAAAASPLTASTESVGRIAADPLAHDPTIIKQGRYYYSIGTGSYLPASRSTDLLHWEVLPPIVGPGEFGQLEVPQAVKLENRWYLVFCTGEHSAQRIERTGPNGNWWGTHVLVAGRLAGPYRMLDDGPLVGSAEHDYYAGRIEAGLTGEPLFFAWRRFDDRRQFIGGLSNPARVNVAPHGALSIEPDELWDASEST